MSWFWILTIFRNIVSAENVSVNNQVNTGVLKVIPTAIPTIVIMLKCPEIISSRITFGNDIYSDLIGIKILGKSLHFEIYEHDFSKKNDIWDIISLMYKNFESGNFQTMKTYIQREEDFRPMYSHENFKNVSFEIMSPQNSMIFQYCQDMEGRENRQIGELVKKIRMNRQWRHVKGDLIMFLQI